MENRTKDSLRVCGLTVLVCVPGSVSPSSSLSGAEAGLSPNSFSGRLPQQPIEHLSHRAVMYGEDRTEDEAGFGKVYRARLRVRHAVVRPAVRIRPLRELGAAYEGAHRPYRAASGVRIEKGACAVFVRLIVPGRFAGEIIVAVIFEMAVLPPDFFEVDRNAAFRSVFKYEFCFFVGARDRLAAAAGASYAAVRR